MSVFEFTMVLLSIILGLAIAELMSGVLRLIRVQSPVRSFWVSASWAAWLLLSLVQTWWNSWGYSSYDLQSWTIWQVLFLITPSLLLFLAAGLVLPTESWASDAWEHYLRYRRPFFGILLLLLLAWSIEWTWVAGQPLVGRGNIGRAVAAILYGTLAISPRPAVHRWGAVIHWGMLTVALSDFLGIDPTDLGF